MVLLVGEPELIVHDRSLFVFVFSLCYSTPGALLLPAPIVRFGREEREKEYSGQLKDLHQKKQ